MDTLIPTLGRLARATSGRLRDADPEAPVGRVVTDSRELEPGDVFLCLRGERFDGHAFASEALAAGAAACVVDRAGEAVLRGSRRAAPVVVVDDTLAALGRAAQEARRAAGRGRDLLVIAITGTNGKTGTKDLTVGALGADRRVMGSPQSYNNHVGVPLTLLGIGRDTDALVCELGTSARGEIASLTSLVEPEVGVITNVQHGHLSGLGSLDGVRAEKGALLEGLVGRRVSVLNRDDPSYPDLARRAPGEVVAFGLHERADLRATDVSCDLHGTRFLCNGTRVAVRHLGRHAVSNALAALACAEVAGVPLARAATALAEVPPPPGRLNVRRVGSVLLLDDSYNANPDSLAAAAATVAELGHGGRRLLVVGDMLELGETAGALHRAAGRALAQTFPDLLLSVGRHAEAVVAGAREVGLDKAKCRACPDRDAAVEALASMVRPGDLVLVKGSRRMALDRLVVRVGRRAAAAAT